MMKFTAVVCLVHLLAWVPRHVVAQSKMKVDGPPPTCPEMDEAKNCTGDLPLLNLLERVQKPFARLGQVCDRIYVINETPQGFMGAMEECCKIGMQLLSVETSNELNCLRKLKLAPTIVWTSATDQNSEFAWMWCSTKKMVEDHVSWSEDSPGDSQEENCAAMDMGEGLKVSDDDCSTSYSFICEAAVKQKEKAYCVAAECLSCDNSKVEFKMPESGFIKLGDACGNTYLQSDTQSDYFTAFKKCCDLGLKLLSVESLEEADCLTPLMKQNSWTSASNLACKKVWQWCSTNATFSPDIRGAIWVEVQSDKSKANNVDNCAFLDVKRSKLREDKCDEQHFYICEELTENLKSKKVSCLSSNKILNVTTSNNKTLESLKSPTTVTNAKNNPTTTTSKATSPVKPAVTVNSPATQTKPGLTTKKIGRRKRAITTTKATTKVTAPTTTVKADLIKITTVKPESLKITSSSKLVNSTIVINTTTSDVCVDTSVVKNDSNSTQSIKPMMANKLLANSSKAETTVKPSTSSKTEDKKTTELKKPELSVQKVANNPKTATAPITKIAATTVKKSAVIAAATTKQATTKQATTKQATTKQVTKPPILKKL